MADTEQTQTEETVATTETTTETTQTDDLGDKGKAAIDKERQARKDAEKRAKDAEARLAELDAAQAKKDEDEAKARGEFEKLANDRLTKLETLQTEHKTLAEERDALLAKVQAFEDRDRKTIADGVKDLPADLREFDPGDDAPLAQRMTWFEKARAIAAKRVTDPQKGNGRSPDVVGSRDGKADDAALRQFEREMARSF